MATLIKSGTLITASETFQADLLIEDGKISQIGKKIIMPAETEIVDAAGKYVLPGGVEAHAHFELPMFGTVSSDDHYSGHRAAAFGGTTTAFDFISQDSENLMECIQAWHEKAREKAAID